MPKKKYDTSKYGVSIANSVGFQVFGGGAAIFAVLLVLLLLNG